MKRMVRMHTLLQSESGMAVMSVVLMGAATMIILFMAPMVFKSARKQSQFLDAKANLQSEVLEVKALFKYPENCKRIMDELIQHGGGAGNLNTKKVHTFSKDDVTNAIQTKGSLQAGSPFSKWEAPGPWTINLEQQMFLNETTYRASLSLEQEAEPGTTTPKPEKIFLYIGLAPNGLLNFCEKTSISTKPPYITFEDQVCILNGPGTPTIRYDPATKKCRTDFIAAM